MVERVRVHVENLGEDYVADDPPAYEKADGNLVTSRVPGHEGLHRPVIDLDFPCELVPSATAGHFHLYLNTELDWPACEKLLGALLDAGLIQQGWYDGCMGHGYMRVRHPDFPKHRPILGPPAPEPEPW